MLFVSILAEKKFAHLVSWIDVNEKKILFLDFRGVVSEKEMINLTKKIYTFLRNETPGSKIRIFIDVTGAFASVAAIEEAIKLERTAMDHFIPKRAIIGISGPKVTLLRAFNLFLTHKVIPFDTREAALEYLVEDKENVP